MTTTREPIQIGAELYGHPGLEADLEVLRLMARALSVAGIAKLHLDIGHPRIYRALTAGANLADDEAEALFHAVQQKDTPGVLGMHDLLGEQRAEAIARLTRLSGGEAVLEQARKELPRNPDIGEAIASFRASRRQAADPGSR